MYKKEIVCQDNEIPARVNRETGEITELRARWNNIPEDKEIFEPDGLFSKSYNKSWEYLRNNFSALEFKAAFSLALMAKANTNSLEPLSDETTYIELSELLMVGKNKVDIILNKLFDYGVYARFEVSDKTKPYTRYWVFNPYLSFSGKLISSDVSKLFKGTRIALNYNSQN